MLAILDDLGPGVVPDELHQITWTDNALILEVDSCPVGKPHLIIILKERSLLVEIENHSDLLIVHRA